MFCDDLGCRGTRPRLGPEDASTDVLSTNTATPQWLLGPVTNPVTSLVWPAPSIRGCARAAEAWLVTSAQVLQLIGELSCTSDRPKLTIFPLFQAPAVTLLGLATVLT